MPQDKMPEEIRSKAVAAAEAVYRLSELKNFDQALKFGLRKQAIGILGRLAALAASFGNRRKEEAEEILSDLAAIQELVRFAAGRLCITPANAEKVLAAYRSIGESIRELAGANGAAADGNGVPPSQNNGTKAAALNERQRRILEYVAANGRAQISDINRIFGGERSEKTLQRDLWQLVNCGLIQRQGDYRWTTYSIGHPYVR